MVYFLVASVLELVEVLPQVDVLYAVLAAVPKTSYRDVLLLTLRFLTPTLSLCLLFDLCLLVLCIEHVLQLAIYFCILGLPFITSAQLVLQLFLFDYQISYLTLELLLLLL